MNVCVYVRIGRVCSWAVLGIFKVCIILCIVIILQDIYTHVFPDAYVVKRKLKINNSFSFCKSKCHKAKTLHKI